MVGVKAALYPTRVTHLHRSPVRHYAEHRSYSWFVDLDDLPRLPRLLRPFARFEAVDHFEGAPDDTLRQRVDAFLARNGVFLPGGRVAALLMPRVLGRAFNPLSLFWCYDAAGTLRGVVAEMQTLAGERRAYLLPPSDGAPVAALGAGGGFAVTGPLAGAGGYFLVKAPEPEDTLDLTVSLHRDNSTAMVATWCGRRRAATAARVLALQFSVPLAPLTAELGMRWQATMLRLLGAPKPATTPKPDKTPARTPRTASTAPHRAARSATTAAWSAKGRTWAPS
jgi:DUF1365 family protein